MLRSAAFFVQRFVLGRRTLLAQVPEFDLELRVPAGDAVGRHLYEDAMHAPAVIDFLATRLELAPDDVVFDIGANIGWYALLLARLAPRGVSIHAFEPDPWARGMLQENLSRNRADAVVVAADAVGESTGAAELLRYGHRRTNGGLLPVGAAEKVSVSMVSLDDYCREHELERRPVGLIKIGIEGFEYFALRGAERTLVRCRAVLAEYAPERLAQAGIEPVALLDLLVAAGFIPTVLDAAGPREVTRDELLAGRGRRHLFWSRPAGLAAPPAPDPRALAI
ncbi:MAG TPA: FkbM family methyltransferase [Gammaproteobacteria bacterium]|nr:FkbM family methyltransferase [Gammaproteobacteria bacterium]